MNKKLHLIPLMAVLILTSCSGSDVEISTENELRSVELPDGSMAYLNQNSSISYDRNFDQRKVNQEGEVFFIIRKGQSPFTIHTEIGKVMVLGTELNVKSDNNSLEVEVEKGVVAVKTNKAIQKINKGQRAVCKDVNKGIQIGNAEFKYKKWLGNLNKDLKKVGKAIKKNTHQIEKSTNKLSTDINKELKTLRKN